MAPRTIKVDHLARVEGEGAFTVTVRDGQVTEAELRIFEPPRFFEAFLRGRQAAEAPDITARICGICPVAYQMSAVQAVEDACGVRVDGALADLRRLLYCGEWIESHVLHIAMLHAPDFLGYPSAVHMAADHADRVKAALALKKAGNAIVTLVGGREIHPVNVRVGGFYRLPAPGDLKALADTLRGVRGIAEGLVEWVAGFHFPDVERDYLLVGLQDSIHYPMIDGGIGASDGLTVPVAEFPSHFHEEQVERSTALHGRTRDGRAYLVGPLARYALNRDRLSPAARAAAEAAGLGAICRNPFRSIVVRAVEVLHAIDTALGIIDGWDPPAAPAVAVPMRAGTGHGATEAPRGLLYHRYRLAADGSIEAASIVPPTSQNQPSIEADLTEVVGRSLELDDDALRDRCELTIRNYDPCISCATHFLRLEIDRG